jgi:hypothetical protein
MAKEKTLSEQIANVLMKAKNELDSKNLEHFFHFLAGYLSNFITRKDILWLESYLKQFIRNQSNS